jgi:hypothetical protein
MHPLGRREQTPLKERRRFVWSAVSNRRLEKATVATALINVRLGQGERVAQQLEARLSAFGDNYFDDIEAKKDVGIIEQPQPGKTAARNSFLFIAINGVGRPSKIFVPPRFYFNKDECVVVTANDVDLASGASAKITIEDLVTVPPQKPARQLLPASPKPKMFGTRSRKPAAPPVRKIGDGSDKAHAHAI